MAALASWGFLAGCHTIGVGDSVGRLDAQLEVWEDRLRSRDDAARARAYRAAAEEGDARAEGGLAMAYLEGRGLERDPEWAAHWLLRAAESDHAGAQRQLGLLYLRGEGVAQDLDAATHWLRRAAEHDEHRLLLEVASLHVDPAGIPRDVRSALGLAGLSLVPVWALARGAVGSDEAGSTPTAAGPAAEPAGGGEAAESPAVADLRRRARAGDAAAQQELGLCHALGHGTARDAKQAWLWLRRAAAAGDPLAAEDLARLEASLPEPVLKVWHRELEREGEGSSG